MASVRIQARFVGHVQGVGFRYTTVGVARRYHVTGTVQNQADGSVRLVAEGETDELERFLGEIQREFAGQIRETLIDRQPASGEFSGFSIDY